MTWIRLVLAALLFTAAVFAAEEKKPSTEERVAVVEAAASKAEQPEAQKRQFETDDEEDQIALESTNVEEKDGAHHPHDSQSYAVAPPAYAAPPAQPYAPSQAQSQPIPVPLPIPVQPASVVLPTAPKQQSGYPAPVAPQPVQYAPQPRPSAGYQQPPPQLAYPQPAPQQVYSQPPQQPSYQQPPPPPPPPAHLAPQPAYPPQLPTQPVPYQQQPPPLAQLPPQSVPYQQPPASLPAPTYHVVPQQSQQLPPQPNYQPVNSAAPQVLPQPSYLEGSQQANIQDVAPASAVAYSPASSGLQSDPWAAPAQDMPKIVALDVKCEKNLMKVNIEFDKPFYGIIFSKGHYANSNCVYVPAGLGRASASFDVSINSCGTTGNTENGLYGYGSQSGSGTFFENTIIIQYDPQVQEVWDQARKLRCTWHDQYEKSITFRPFPVDMLDVVRADFAGDNVGCWMQIQVGKGPWASEVSGLVKIGQTMTMVLAIKDDENKFDMLVRNCMAHDGKRAPIQLVDQRGCVTRPKLMSRFTKIKNFGASASVLSYAHFQAFKFPDSMEVHFQCTIQICRHQCPDQCSGEGSIPQQGIPNGYSERTGQPSAARPREERLSKRDVSQAEKQDVGINRIIQVVSTGDLTFALEQTKDNTTTIVFPSRRESDGLICMTSPGFAATLVVLLAILIISCLLSAFLCIRHRTFGAERSLVSAFANPAFAHKKGHF